MTRLESMVNDKLLQWSNGAMCAAKRAQILGVEAILVEYPTGLQMMRFAEPFGAYGMFYEVTTEQWDYLKNGGKLYLND